MVQIKVGETLYQAAVKGKLVDPSWDGRATKEITLKMSYSEAIEVFVNNVAWGIVEDYVLEDGTTGQMFYDNSDFSIAGDLTDHRDGTVTVKMGKPTELENALALLLGGEGNV